jgi:signal transduction histidine kinase/ActR/RegA family two-component response regulator
MTLARSLASSNEVAISREFQAQIAERLPESTKVNVDSTTEMLRMPARPAEDAANVDAPRIAHDFNNILNLIQAHVALIKSHPAEQNKVLEDAQLITTAVEEGVKLVQQLLPRKRNTEPKFELADINELLRRTTRSLNPVFPPTVAIEADLDPNVPMIMLSTGFIYQIILNLCINARDAMPNGGRILLRSRTASGAALRKRFPEAKAEQYVYISFADTGMGMKADVRSRVFDRYFTTKKPSEGTGLGLSIVYDNLREHGGFAEVTSVPGCGSVFHIYLPTRGEEVAGNSVDVLSASLPSAKVVPVPNGIQTRQLQNETVLYAEDDGRLAGLMRRLLEKEGLEVLIARDGLEAVELHSRHQQRVGIAFLDFGLPKLNGWEAFQRMRKVNPRLKAIIASGYVSSDVELQLAKGELSGVLQKPYFGEEVLAIIKQTINGETK